MMKFKTAAAVFLIIMSFGILAYKVAWDGWYPIAIVNYRIITEQAFEKSMDVVYGFSKNLISLSGSDPEKLKSPEFISEVKLEVLNNLISRELILQELKKSVGLNQAAAIAEKNIANALSGKADTAEGIEKLYGLSLAEFKDSVLLPQAYREILAGRMNLNNKDFDAWLNNARKTSSVLIFYPGFGWDGVKAIEK